MEKEKTILSNKDSEEVEMMIESGDGEDNGEDNVGVSKVCMQISLSLHQFGFNSPTIIGLHVQNL